MWKKKNNENKEKKNRKIYIKIGKENTEKNKKYLRNTRRTFSKLGKPAATLPVYTYVLLPASDTPQYKWAL